MPMRTVECKVWVQGDQKHSKPIHLIQFKYAESIERNWNRNGTMYT